MTEAASAKPEFLAQPPGPCCWAGTLHEGSPRGGVEDILGAPTYVVRPSDVKNAPAPNGHVVLYFPDVWGLSVNAQCLLDGFAAAGYTALGMDYFRGDPISLRIVRALVLPTVLTISTVFYECLLYMLGSALHSAFAAETVPRWTAVVRARFGAELRAATGTETRFACVGYCFGAPYVCDLLAGVGGDGGEPAVSAGAFAHPTALKEEHFAGVKRPLLLSCAENDHAFPTESRRKAIDVLQKEGKVYHLQLFQGVGHGFAVKGDPSDPYQRWCKEQSLKAIIDWFDMWLIRSS
ncbi:dienelactone hydrolase [Colletotrichum graminicola M1.001]|uniref:Dienelactone hydrolase n=1 Tax=Colletotrichum graminicola (strain M1.001 / M2 / FGSC 10212) TaxID=645133 RepID=E3Q4P3_COLGM|nr:dienelactone hydrolase [Colletotrichum graminicola M1.001]EFQ26058.1 dienelactone hydrolase [Colletotrichum graminicola M1.001]